MSPHFQNFKNASSKRSSALVITLVVLVLVTLLVVSLSSMIALERTSTHESFESQRAREFSTIAVDEVVALLRDSIPANSMWAAAPGKIEFFPTPTSTTATTVPLYSGQATGTASSTGQVDLNAPVLGASISTYPIISTNAEYPSQTPMPMGWIEVLQDGTLVRPGSASSKDPNNPVVGRYAYWVDTETSKANINTAGRGQTSYYFDGTNFAGAVGGVPTTHVVNAAMGTNNDLQNLTGAPSRLDLSQLGGGITTNQSMATYHYTYGGNWLPQGVGDFTGFAVYTGNSSSGQPAQPGTPISYPYVPTNGPGGVSQGMRRFPTIQQWPQMTNDLITSAAVTPITPAQVEQNKFYLTSRSWTPDVTPWGFNKMWLQSSPVNPFTSTPWWATYGNKINAKGAPGYPTNALAAQMFSAPSSGASRGVSSAASENRYYLTPFIPTNAASLTPDFGWAGQYVGNYNRTTAFVQAMMVQLNRTDWPGFNGQSFVGKYGQAECEDLAFNLLCLYDSAIHSNGEAPMLNGAGPAANGTVDMKGEYGSAAQYTIDGKTRLFSGVGEWPYINQVSVRIAPAPLSPAVGSGTSPTTTAASASRYTGFLTNSYGTANKKTVTSYTKVGISTGGGNIGFAPIWTVSTDAGATPVNVGIIPSIQIIYPVGFKNPYVSNGGASMIDVEAYATGTFHGTNVTYGTTTAVDPEPPPASNSTYHPYYWGVLDCYKAGATTNAGLGIVPKNPLTAITTITSSGTGSPAGYYTYNFPTVYMGPFDQNSVVTDVQLRCRFVLHNGNIRTFDCPTEIVPLAYNACSAASGANENMCFTNVMTGVAPTFHFGMNDLGNSNALFTGDTVSSVYVAYDLDDPRVYRYLADWTERVGTTSATGGIVPGNRTGYHSSYADGLTGVTGDDSKLAWPDIGAGYFNSGEDFFAPMAGYGGDLRLLQNANNIVGFPGIGWLSVLPLNCESSQGTVALGTGSGDPAHVGKPVPWRTLSLEPTPASNSLQSGGKIPDWLLLEAFALAYDQTFCSQTEGKINVNLALTPQFPSGTTIPPRTKPLQALIAPATYAASVGRDNPALTASTIAADIGKGQSGSTYTAPYGSSLPNDILMYPGQLCQFSSMAGTGTTQWQRESLMRNLAGIVTTQCSDFKVHVVAQAVKQVAFNGNPISDFVVTGEQRMSAIVSRATNLGPDNLPDTSDDPVNSTLVTPASFTPASASPNTGIQGSLTNGTPSFKYVISDINYINN